MDLWLDAKRAEGPEIRFPCPCCGEAEAIGQTREERERLSLFGLVPLFELRNTFVRCGACGQESISKIPPSALAECEPEALAGRLRPRRSKGSPIAAVLALLAFWVPAAGLAVAAFSLFKNGKAGGWKKWGSLVAFLLSIALHAVLFGHMLGL